MQCNVYDAAVQRIAILRAELQRLQAFVSTYEELADGAEKGDAVAAEGASVTGRQRRERPKPTPQAVLERVVEQILVANGSPLQRAELLHHVKALGLVVGGRNELANFGSKLSRAERLVNLSSLGYWPKHMAFEPACDRPASAADGNDRDGKA